MNEVLQKYVESCAGGNEQLEAEMMADADLAFFRLQEFEAEMAADVEELSDDLDEPETDIEQEVDASGFQVPLEGADRDCWDLLQQIKARHEADKVTWESIAKGEASVELPEGEASRYGQKVLPRKELDKGAWDEILAEPAGGDAPPCPGDLLTLSAVFKKVRLGNQELKSLDPAMDHLWQCLINLRAGSDGHLIPCPEKVRVSKAKLNWHQLAEKQAAIIRAIAGLPAKRTSRAEAWRNLAAGLKKKCDWSDASVEVANGQVVLYVPPRQKSWRVGLVLTVWRYTAKKGKRVGARPVTLPIPLDLTRYIRVCELTCVDENKGIWRHSIDDDCDKKVLVCDVNRVGLFLQVSQARPSMDGYECMLTEKSMQAVQHAHLWDEWPPHLKNCDDFRTAKASMADGSANSKTTKTTKGSKRKRNAKVVSAQWWMGAR